MFFWGGGADIAVCIYNMARLNKAVTAESSSRLLECRITHGCLPCHVCLDSRAQVKTIVFNGRKGQSFCRQLGTSTESLIIVYRNGLPYPQWRKDNCQGAGLGKRGELISCGCGEDVPILSRSDLIVSSPPAVFPFFFLSFSGHNVMMAIEIAFPFPAKQIQLAP